MTLSSNGSYAPRSAPVPPASPSAFAARAKESVLDRVIRVELALSEREDRVGWLTTTVERLEVKVQELEAQLAAGGGVKNVKAPDVLNEQILTFLKEHPDMEFSPLALARNLERKHGEVIDNSNVAGRLKRMEGRGEVVNVGDRTPFYMLAPETKEGS